MEELFSRLTDAVGGGPAVAACAAFAWGVLSVILSPCHLSSIPLVVGYVSGQGEISTRRAFVVATVFAGGVAGSIGVIGVLTWVAGRTLGDLGGWVNYAVAVMFFVVGLYLLGVISMPWDGRGQSGARRRGLVGAVVLGFVYGAALGPCTFAYMAPVLGVVFASAGTRPMYAAVLLGAYAAGHSSVIVAAGTSAEAVQKWLDWNERSKGTVILKKACGVLVILAGAYMIYTAP